MADRIYVRIVETLIIVGLTLMIALSFISTILRFVPTVGGIYWAEELTRYTSIWVVFIAGGLGIRHGIHLGVDVFIARLPAAARRITSIITYLLMLVFEGVLLYFGAMVTAWNVAQQSSSLEVPMSTFYAAIPVGAAMMIFETLRALWRVLHHYRGVESHQEEYSL
jgi:C4-dicarboxylate transporter DctQ subunit